MIKNHLTIQRKPQINTTGHWILLILFGCLAYGTLIQQFILILLFIVIVSIARGPLMILWGMVYAALVAFFPPLGLLLSCVFFLLNLGTVAKSWRISLISSYFYLVPLSSGILRLFLKNESPFLLPLFIAVGILGLHYLLQWLYKYNSLSRSVTWTIIGIPYTLLLMLSPARFHRIKKNSRRNR